VSQVPNPALNGDSSGYNTQVGREDGRDGNVDVDGVGVVIRDGDGGDVRVRVGFSDVDEEGGGDSNVDGCTEGEGDGNADGGEEGEEDNNVDGGEEGEGDGNADGAKEGVGDGNVDGVEEGEGDGNTD